MNFGKILAIAVFALLLGSAFAQMVPPVDDGSGTPGTGSDDSGSTPPASNDDGATSPSPSPEPDTETSTDPSDSCKTNPDGSTSCVINPAPQPGPNCDGLIGMGPNGTPYCDTPGSPPAGQTVPPQPTDDDTPPTDGGSSSSSSSGSSGGSSGGSSSSAGSRPHICSGVGYKLNEGKICTGKITDSVFDGPCCSVPGTVEATPVPVEEAPVETVEEPVVEIPTENEAGIGNVSALPVEDVTSTETAPATGFAGLLGNPQAIGLGFIILAVLLLAGYLYSEQQKK